MRAFLRSHTNEALALAAILAVVGLTAIYWQDVRGFDEALYMRQGLDARSPTEITWRWGPVYSDVYFALGSMIQDPLTLYMAGRVFSASAFVLGIWLAVRLIGSAVAASVVGIAAAVAPVTYAWPGVANAASSLLIVAVALICRFRSYWAYSVAVALLWVSAGMRPELLPAAATTTTVGFMYFVKRVVVSRRMSRQLQGDLLGLLLQVAVPLVLVLVHGSPFAAGVRSWVAFSQHYSLRNARPGEDAWSQAASIVQRDFPGAEGILNALIVSPDRFLEHVSRNALEAGPQLISGLFFNTLAYPAYNLLAGVTFGALSLSVVLGTLRSRSRVWSTLKGRFRLGSLSWIWLSLVGISSLFSVLVIYPRDHYLAVWSALLFLIAGGAITLFPPSTGRLAILPSKHEIGFAVAVIYVVAVVGGLLSVIQLVVDPPKNIRDIVSLSSTCSNISLAEYDVILSPFISDSKVATDPNLSGDRDLNELQAAGVTVIRVDESRISTLESGGNGDNLRNAPFERLVPGSELFVSRECRAN